LWVRPRIGLRRNQSDGKNNVTMRLFFLLSIGRAYA
jgi:hypothetical protein